MNNAIDIGRERQITALRLIGKFGHLRPADLSTFFSLNDVPWHGKIAERTLRTLNQKKLVIPRNNALGCTSYVLSAAGARHLEHVSGISAKTGKDLTTTGPSFLHRSLGALGLIVLEHFYQKHHDSFSTFSEYEMQRGLGPIDSRGRATRLGNKDIQETLEYAPDCVIETAGNVIDWIEVEASWKNSQRLCAKLEWFADAFRDEYQQLYSRNDHSIAQLRRVIWVIPIGDQWFDHEARLRKQITHLGQIPPAEWFILRLHITQRLNLTGYELIKINS